MRIIVIIKNHYRTSLLLQLFQSPQIYFTMRVDFVKIPACHRQTQMFGSAFLYPVAV